MWDGEGLSFSLPDLEMQGSGRGWVGTMCSGLTWAYQCILTIGVRHET